MINWIYTLCERRVQKDIQVLIIEGQFWGTIVHTEFEVNLEKSEVWNTDFIIIPVNIVEITWGWEVGGRESNSQKWIFGKVNV